MKRTIKWLVVLSLLALPVFTAVARVPRPPRPVLNCDPDNVHSLRDLVWFIRHCRTKIVREAVVTTSGNILPPSPYPSPFVWPMNTPPPTYPAPPTRTSSETPTSPPEGWTASPTPTYSYPTWPPCFKVYSCECMGYPCPEDYTTTPGLGTPTPTQTWIPSPPTMTRTPTSTRPYPLPPTATRSNPYP